MYFFPMWISKDSIASCWQDYPFVHWITLEVLSEISWPSMCRSISGFSLICHWSTCPSFYQYHSFCTFIISLEIRYCKPPFVFFFQNCLTLLYPSHLHINSLSSSTKRTDGSTIGISLNLQLTLERTDTLTVSSLLL